MQEVLVSKKEEKTEERKECGLSERDLNKAAESWNVTSRKPRFFDRFKKEQKTR